ncbi:MAG: PAS domain S-box protein, partial [Deltaproteobacteria bacterium]
MVEREASGGDVNELEQQLLGVQFELESLRRSARRSTENEELFGLLVESVRDYAIFMLDPSGHVATWNVGARRIKGYTADEIVGRHFSAFY